MGPRLTSYAFKLTLRLGHYLVGTMHLPLVISSDHKHGAPGSPDGVTELCDPRGKLLEPLDCAPAVMEIPDVADNDGRLRRPPSCGRLDRAPVRSILAPGHLPPQREVKHASSVRGRLSGPHRGRHDDSPDRPQDTEENHSPSLHRLALPRFFPIRQAGLTMVAGPLARRIPYGRGMGARP
jgi:hypothetical protein